MPRKKKTIIRSKFKKWLAIPERKRKEATGIGTQSEFADAFPISQATLSRWKKEPGFLNGVEGIRRQHLDEKLSDIYETLIQRAKEGDPQAIKMAFEQAGRYKEEIRDDDEEEEEYQEQSNRELASSMASMLADSTGLSEPVLEARILDSLGEDVPDDLKDRIKEESTNGQEDVQSGKDDEDEGTDEAQAEEGPPESEEDESETFQKEEVKEKPPTEEDEEFELENHLMDGMDDDVGEFNPDTAEDDEPDPEDLDSTEEFEVPLDW